MSDHNDNWEEEYRRTLKKFYDFGSVIARKRNFNGLPTGWFGTDADKRTFLTGQVKSRPEVDLLYGLVPEVTAEIGAPLPRALTDAELPNPSAWAMGVITYLEARTLGKRVGATGKEELLSADENDRAFVDGFWRDANRIRAVLAHATSKETVDRAVDGELITHAKVSGLGGTAIARALRALGGSSTVITRPETSIRELVLGQQNVVCTEPVS